MRSPVLLTLGVLLVACGGGDDDSAPTTTTTTATPTTAPVTTTTAATTTTVEVTTTTEAVSRLTDEVRDVVEECLVFLGAPKMGSSILASGGDSLLLGAANDACEPVLKILGEEYAELNDHIALHGASLNVAALSALKGEFTEADASDLDAAQAAWLKRGRELLAAV